MVRGGFFLRKNPLDRSGSPYTNSAFALTVCYWAACWLAAAVTFTTVNGIALNTP